MKHNAARRRVRGSILIYVLVMLTAIAALILVGAELGVQSLRQAGNREDSTTARYLFEAALEQLSADLDSGARTVPGTFAYTISDVDFSVPVTVVVTNDAPMPQSSTARATISWHGRTFAFERTISRHPTPHPAFFAIYSKKSITVDPKLETGSSEKDGDIYIGDDLQLKHAASVINGDLDVVGTAAIGGATVVGEVAQPLRNVPFPNPNEPDYRNNWTSWQFGGSTINGSLFISLGRNPLVYVDGDLTLRGTFTGQGVIFAKRKVTINGNISYGSSGSRLVVIAAEDIVVENGATSLKGFFYTKRKFQWKGSGPNILSSGAICAEQVDLDGSTKVIHDPFFFENPSEGAKYYLPGVWNP